MRKEMPAPLRRRTSARRTPKLVQENFDTDTNTALDIKLGEEEDVIAPNTNTTLDIKLDEEEEDVIAPNTNTTLDIKLDEEEEEEDVIAPMTTTPSTVSLLPRMPSPLPPISKNSHIMTSDRRGEQEMDMPPADVQSVSTQSNITVERIVVAPPYVQKLAVDDSSSWNLEAVSTDISISKLEQAVEPPVESTLIYPYIKERGMPLNHILHTVGIGGLV